MLDKFLNFRIENSCILHSYMPKVSTKNFKKFELNSQEIPCIAHFSHLCAFIFILKRMHCSVCGRAHCRTVLKLAKVKPLPHKASVRILSPKFVTNKITFILKVSVAFPHDGHVSGKFALLHNYSSKEGSIATLYALALRLRLV